MAQSASEQMGAAVVAGNSPNRQLQKYFTQNRDQLMAALPKHIKADRMIRLAMTAFSQNRALAQCDLKTVFASVVVASQMGLEIGVAGQGYLVPYKGKCTFIPGWQGMVDLVSRAGRAVVWTGAVFDGDYFEYEMGDSPSIKHRPSGEDNPDKILFTYAVGRVKGAEWPVIEVWPMKRLKAHFKKNNKVGAQHYAFNNWEMYCRKIPLLQVIKYMPKSVELQNMLDADSALEEGKNVTIEGDFLNIDDPDQPGGGGGDAGGDTGGGGGVDTETGPKKRTVVDMAGEVLFIAEGDTAVGAAGKFKDRDYVVKEITPTHIKVEFAAAGKTASQRREPAAGPGTPAASAVDKVKKIINDGKNAKDLDVADLRLDEARSMIAELPEADRDAPNELLAAAVSHVKKRRTDGA